MGQGEVFSMAGESYSAAAPPSAQAAASAKPPGEPEPQQLRKKQNEWAAERKELEAKVIAYMKEASEARSNASRQKRLLDEIEDHSEHLKRHLVWCERRLLDVNGANAEELRRMKEVHGIAAHELPAAASASQELASFRQPVREYYEAEQQILQKTAKATIKSLKGLLQKKNREVQELREKLEALKREYSAERAVDSAERSRLAQLEYEENKRTIERLRAAVCFFSHNPISLLSTLSLQVEQLEGAPEAVAAAAANAEVLERLEVLEKEKASLHHELVSARAKIGAMNDALSSARADAATAEEEAENLRSELAKLQESGNKQGKGSEKLVKLLRDQLGMKETKLRRLQTALKGLQQEVVTLNQEHAAALATARSVGRRGGDQPTLSSVLEGKNATTEGKDTGREMERKVSVMERPLLRLLY